MLGGNPKDGWCYLTRNPGFFDTVKQKHDMKAFVILQSLKRMLDDIIEKMVNTLGVFDLENKEGDDDFRNTYV
ncbi:MAG: hypothetical protein ACTSWQ_00555 [Candidatus Thorarchaeota archaeon]